MKLASRLLLNGHLETLSKPPYAPISMKKTERKMNRQTMNLGDLIMTVSSCSKNNRETVAAVADLLASGRVMVQANGHACRAQLVR